MLIRESAVLMEVFVGIFFTLIFDLYLPHRSSYGFAAFLPLLVLFPARFYYQLILDHEEKTGTRIEKVA